MADRAFTALTSAMISHLEPDSFKPHPLTDALEYRDLGISELSGGAINMGIFRASSKGGGSGWHTHDLKFHLAYVLKGWAVFEYEGVGKVKIEAGAAIYQPPWNKHRELEQSPDFEVLEVTLPAEFDTHVYHFDKAKGEYVAYPVQEIVR